MRAAQRIPLDFIATGLYFGKIPFAPGTWGTLPGIALLWLVADFPLWSKLLIAALLFMAECWCAIAPRNSMVARTPPV